MLPLLNRKLESTISYFVSENLSTVKLLKAVGIDKALESVKKETNVMDYLKLKFLDKVKDTDIAKKHIEQDNILILKKIATSQPHIQDAVFERFFAPHDLNSEKINDISTAEGRADLFNEMITPEYKDGVHVDKRVAIQNPFTDHVITTYLSSLGAKNTHEDGTQSDKQSFMIPLPIAHSLAKSRFNNMLYLSENSAPDAEAYGFKALKAISPLQVKFDYILYHELAHAGYSQLLLNPTVDFYNESCKKEKNSDLSAIIKMIKNYDLNKEEAHELCDMVIKFRIELTKNNPISVYSNEKLMHFTEDAIFALKQVVDHDFGKIKEIPDKEIGRYANCIIEAGEMTSGLGFKGSNIGSPEVEKMFGAALKTRNRNNPELEVHTGVNDLYTVYEKLQDNKDAYTEIILSHRVRLDPDNAIKEIHDEFKGGHIAAVASLDYELYKNNKKAFTEDLGPKIDNKTLQKKLNM